jgi:predicted ATPase
LAFAATLRLLRRGPDQAVRFLDELMPFCEEHRLTLWEANGMIRRGWALAEMGHARQALHGLQEGIERRIAAGSRLRLPLQLAARAHALARAGEVDAAEAVVAEALAEMERTGERTWESFIHWICGRVIAARPQADLERAAGCFQTACEIARRQGAKSMELRAATSVAGLWLEQGCRKDARKLLAPIYEWFTEGFDTADLEEAKSLLEELS